MSMIGGRRKALVLLLLSIVIAVEGLVSPPFSLRRSCAETDAICSAMMVPSVAGRSPPLSTPKHVKLSTLGLASTTALRSVREGQQQQQQEEGRKQQEQDMSRNGDASMKEVGEDVLVEVEQLKLEINEIKETLLLPTLPTATGDYCTVLVVQCIIGDIVLSVLLVLNAGHCGTLYLMILPC